MRLSTRPGACSPVAARLCMFLVYSIIRLFAQSGSHRRTCTWSRAQSHRDVIVLMRYLVLPRNPDHVSFLQVTPPDNQTPLLLANEFCAFGNQVSLSPLGANQILGVFIENG